MNDQELQKITDEMSQAYFHYDSPAYWGMFEYLLKKLTQVRDAQEEKLRIARDALTDLASGCCDSTTAYRKAKEALEKIGGVE